MLKIARVADTASANRLVKLWTARYRPDLSVLFSLEGAFPVTQIMEATSRAGRAKTVETIRRSLGFNCDLAGFKTYALFAESTCNLGDAKRSAKAVEQVYNQALEIYLQQPPLSNFFKFLDSTKLFNRLGVPELTLPSANRLAEALEPALLQLQQQHQTSQDKRAIGFLTTHFSLSTRKILQPLTVYEQVLLTPYLAFIEEQVCMPWQRICAAVAPYPSDSPHFVLAEQLFANSQEVAQTVYHQAVQLYPHHRSRRGAITDPEVAASIVRDLNMFQSYLCLCILEKSMASAEQELLLLCRSVLPSIGVEWKLAELVLYLLIEEIRARANLEQIKLLMPYTQALQALFAA